ncbi:MAG: hypothetical protein K2J80_06495 [Oscillospiraceae bacterium]|nr:hypothetical protein [Oscillospiraceae bacterium]
MITFERLKTLAENNVSHGGEPEIWLNFSDKKNDYMIIAFDGGCSFQRCSTQGRKPHDGSGELFYNTLNELYETETVDGILLKRDWDKITEIWCDNFDV